MKPHLLLHGSATLVAAGLFMAAAPARAGHVYAGIVDSNGDGTRDALAFVDTVTSDAGYGQAITGASLGVQPMNPALAGPQAGLYLTSNISYTALSNGHYWTGAAYAAASPFASTGSFIELGMSNVSGPAGAHFSWWDTGVDANNPVMTFTLGVGLTYVKPGWAYGNGLFNLSDPTLLVGDGVNDGVGEPPTTVDGTSGADPYGHIHGRSFTVDAPGAYSVAFVLHDLNNKVSDSAPFTVTYNAVPEPAAWLSLAAGAAGLGFALHRRRRAAKAS